VILDTNIVIRRIKSHKPIVENITIVTVIEYPFVLSYSGFRGNVYFPSYEDYELAYKIQLELASKDLMKGFADLLIAAISINNNEELMTNDRDFSRYSMCFKA